MLQEDSKSPKLWDIEDPFIYAPARPDSDPWSTLLRPELEKDKKQCDIWVDEVQNLLIFAGLFSAVVTAFLVESYKNLQPDPNDIIIGLLSQIAIRMESQNASTLPALNNASFSQFSPTASSVRVNVFWFISLVLSLTTVLVGIVSLQWLQEHRSYPGLSSREIYTLLHMRTQSLEAWRVPLIFATMPLFLQSALVLFLIGLIDFLAPFGIKIVAPVSITIGITMFFLIYTTLCPAFQGAGLYLWFKSKCLRYPSNLRIPTPCPYKSPQARVAQNVAWYFTKVYCQIYRIFQKDNGHHTDVQSILALICEAYEHSTTAWKPFDIVWLSIRDEYMRGSQGSAAGISINMKPTVDRFPIIDVVRALQHTIRTIGKEKSELTMASIYHCLAEISQDIYSHSLLWQDFRQQNDYFQDLLRNGNPQRFTRLSSLFGSQGEEQLREHYANRWGPVVLKRKKALHHENLYILIEQLQQQPSYSSNKVLNTHKLELAFRLTSYFYLNAYGIRPIVSNNQLGDIDFPSCLSIDRSSVYNSDHAGVFMVQLADLTFIIFQRISSAVREGTLQSQDSLATSGIFYFHFPILLQRVRQCMISLPLKRDLHRDIYGTISEKFNATFKFIASRLEEELLEPDTEKKPSLLFYCAATFVRKLATDITDPDIAHLLAVLLDYKTKTIDIGLRNRATETLLGSPVLHRRGGVFYNEWWDFLDYTSHIRMLEPKEYEGREGIIALGVNK